MKPTPISTVMLVVSLLLAPALLAQSPGSANQSAVSPAASAAEVPRLIKFSGTLLDSQDRPLAGPVGVTFALHAQQTGGAALWLETQNVTPDAHGNYTVLLGANSTNGVPAELFASAEARWLEVQVERQAEQPRILLVSVPYALKAKDAETLGGRPASAFLTTETLAGNSAGATTGASSSSAALPSLKTQSTVKKTSSAPQPAAACANVTSDGTAAVNSIALFSTACNLQGSLMTQALINGFPGVNLAGNNAGLLLNGTGTHQVTVTSTTTGVSGRLGEDATGFFFSSDTKGKVVKFLTNNGTLNEWMRITDVGNVGIGTTTPGAKLEIAGGNLALPSTTSGGAAGVITLGGTPFLHDFGTNNTFVGASAGNTSLTGTSNTGAGTSALQSNTTGTGNSAFGAFSLNSNTTGGFNAAFGNRALVSNTTGGANAAFGAGALTSNTTAANNSAFGFQALFHNTTAANNSAFGYAALFNNTTGGSNSAFGLAALNSNTTGSDNAAFGFNALGSNTTASDNTAVGRGALQANTVGINNTAVGSGALSALAGTGSDNNTAVGENALLSTTTACCNTAVGLNSLLHNTTGSSNTAVGIDALAFSTTACCNTAVGSGALNLNTTGGSNAAFGTSALIANTTGSFNIAIGESAGTNLTSGSSDIYIGNAGLASESNIIRIGSVGTHAAAYIAGIFGKTVVSGDGVGVFVGSAGQLGTAPSSRRYKDDIVDMAGESDLLMKLRPVSFYYKPELDSTHTRQYGLVAEEVAQVAPELVVFDKDGVPQTVRYHFVNAMLLNEVQKQQSTIARQQAEIQDLAARLAKLEALVVPAR